MSGNIFFDLLDLPDGRIGLVLGVLVCREILERQGEEAAKMLHRQSITLLLKKIASGDLIMQDQLMTGSEFDPLTEQKFQEIAEEFLRQRQ